MLVVGSWNHHHSHLNLRDVKTYKIERHQMPGLVVPSHLLTQKNRQNCGEIEIIFVYLQQKVGLH